MAKDLLVFLDDSPGRLAVLGEILGKAGVNIMGLFGAPAGGDAAFHILVEDAPAARRALDAAKFHVHEEREVLVIPVDDRPGELGRLCRQIADANVNIELVYLATNTSLVFGVDNLEKARAVVEAM
jgi:hypothetical protein